MDILKYIELAAKLGLPGIVSDVVSGVVKMKEAAAESRDVFTDADLAELDAIHARALEVTDTLITKADAASKR